ncbi:hypothetical protein HYX14_02485 [Candidatus Woesearchaeota archaeon]|nr:hypothetical protein [Candidatus Woesearchaeota archaeon]
MYVGDEKVTSSPKAYQTPTVVWIFGNKVVNILWTKTPIAFSIENPEVAQSYREYFEYLWKIK